MTTILTTGLEMTSDSPFFILGCVRSGTTLLRDVLRSSERLECPEETHYYRWGQPFGSNAYRTEVTKRRVLKRHRRMDKVDEAVFDEIVATASSRRDFQDRYMAAFLAGAGNEEGRWFDKSPQNIYGLSLLAHDYPAAQFVHIVRNPLNVVASLMVGKVIGAPSVVAAANYWQEAVGIFNTMRPAIKTRSYELKYETFTSDPKIESKRLMKFLGENTRSLTYSFSKIHAEQDQYLSVLSDEDIAVVRDICGKWAEHYGYDLTVKGKP